MDTLATAHVFRLFCRSNKTLLACGNGEGSPVVLFSEQESATLPDAMEAQNGVGLLPALSDILWRGTTRIVVLSFRENI